MKKITLLLACLVCFGSIFAQSTDFLWGNTIKTSAPTDGQVIGVDEDGIYMYQYVTKPPGVRQHFIAKYTKDVMALEYSKELAMPKVKGKAVDLENIICLRGKMYLLTSYYDKSTDKKFLYMNAIDKDGTVATEYKEIDNIEGVKRRRMPEFNCIISNDSSKLAVLHDDIPLRDSLQSARDSSQKFTLRLFDSNMNQLIQKSFFMDKQDVSYEVAGNILDADTNLYILAKTDKEQASSKRPSKKNTYKYEFLVFQHDTDIVYLYDAGLKDKFVIEEMFKVNSNQDIIGAGLYAAKPNGPVAGSFEVKVDGHIKRVTSSFKDFDKDFLTGGPVLTHTAKADMPVYNLQNLFLRDDGSAVLIAEERKINRVCANIPEAMNVPDAPANSGFNFKFAAPKNGCDLMYHYGNTLVASFNLDGTVSWMKLIPKIQDSREDDGGYSSLLSWMRSDNLYLIYNDNPANLKLKNPKEIKSMSGSGSQTILVSVDKTGEFERSALFTAKDVKTYIRPRTAFPVGKNDVVVYTQKMGGSYRYCVITLY